jgi:tRNA(Ile)-lysidine synthase
VSELLENFKRTLRGRKLLKHGQRVLVAVSGGLDSMVLLHLLHELSSEWRLVLTIAHLNHRLRGRSSDADERLVMRAAHKLELPIVRESVDVKKTARQYKLSLEMAARKVRHDFLARTAVRLRVPTVALAHHADDQAELFFLRLLRGSGNESLAGMKWRAPSPANRKIELIRPLLDQPKAALADYAFRKKIRFREDASNASLDFQRNRIRHELLPLLRRHYQPALGQVISRAMNLAEAESEYVRLDAVKWLNGEKRTPFNQLPIALQRRCLQLQLLERGIAVDYELVENLRTNPRRPINISSDRRVLRSENGLLTVQNLPASKTQLFPPSNTSEAIIELETPHGKGRAIFSGLEIEWRFDSRKFSGPVKIKPVAGREIFDADKVGPTIVLRHWNPGDRFQPIGMKSPVKLQDLFTNEKIPRQQRHRLVVAVTHGGIVFWVENLRISGQFAVSDRTIRHLHWHWKRP